LTPEKQLQSTIGGVCTVIASLATGLVFGLAAALHPSSGTFSGDSSTRIERVACLEELMRDNPKLTQLCREARSLAAHE
jgi:hypothetical protein